MNYEKYDLEKESGFIPMYHEMHDKIILTLKKNPMTIYEIAKEMGENYTHILSGQMQFLKKKNIVMNKKIEGIYIWGLCKGYR